MDFYPTPQDIINTMMMGEDVAGKTVLEPSAGSGNIVRWLKENGAKEVIACENDKNLQKLLAGECRLIAEDFLTVTAEQVSHIDYIVMNPPFSDGVKHIKHAFDIAPAGCVIVALCNSTNLDNRYTSSRQELYELVELYGGSEHLGRVFDTAERKTNVEVSLIKLYKEGDADNEFDGFFFSNEEDSLNNNETEGLVTYNVVRELVNRYVSAVKLFDETMEANKRINDVARYTDYHVDQPQDYGFLPIRFAVVDERGHDISPTRQQYKKQLQKYYWGIIFKKLNMEKYATKELREQINRFVEKQTSVPFTMHNIYQVIYMVIQTTGQRMDKALLEAFDMICSFSDENSTAGEKWKTNANYMINKKFIVPYIVDYDNKYPSLYEYVKINYWGNSEKIADVTKALCYISGRDYDTIPELGWYLKDRRVRHGEWFKWGFFRVKGFKKGTMHFEFLDEDLWMAFNQTVAKQRGWVLPKKSKRKSK